MSLALLCCNANLTSQAKKKKKKKKEENGYVVKLKIYTEQESFRKSFKGKKLQIKQ